LPGKSIFFNCLKESKFFLNLPEEIEIFQTFAWKTQNFCEIA